MILMDNDADLFFLTNRCGREGTLEECYADLQRLDKIIAFMQQSNATTAAEAGWYYDITPLIQAKEEIYARIQQLQEIEAMRQAQGIGDSYTITQADYEAIAQIVFDKMTNAGK